MTLTCSHWEKRYEWCEGERRACVSENEEGTIPYVVAVFSAQELVYESVTTRPGFLPESLMILAEKIYTGI